MKQEYKTLLFGLVAVGFLDTHGSITSSQFDFNYSLLSLISFIIYGTTAFIATRQRDIKTGMIYAAILGLFDTTVGWKISMLLDANTGDIENQATRGLWIITAIIGTGVAALFGLLGSGLTRITGK
ncbi:MAG: hypothetical protein IPF95_08400 [Flavobacteriales bacterium]|nr:hypothetical protein [Flavobacteriales bacterium]MBK6943542.1 hypothetical protein [Flavobacteriales bacterium]MBK7297255.1 hypothetical protein [Flavobacteriales bacterium]MBP9138893.1 hypothetical protein [Flavobacteriales bacterium]HQV51745.1 hypothetical protein [Flavobacteriales bacterium]